MLLSWGRGHREPCFLLVLLSPTDILAFQSQNSNLAHTSDDIMLFKPSVLACCPFPYIYIYMGLRAAERTLKTGSQREQNYYDFCRKHKEGWKWAGIIWNSVPAPSVNEQLNLIGRLLHITVKWVHFSCAAARRHFQWQHGDTCMVIRK